MSSESTPSSSLAPANLSSTITSSFFSILQNRNIIHIVCEVVIISITSYYFYKKTNTLSNQIKILEAKIEQLENESKKQKVFLDEKLADIISAVNSHMMSQMYQPQHIQPQPQHIQPQPQQRKPPQPPPVQQQPTPHPPVQQQPQPPPVQQQPTPQTPVQQQPTPQTPVQQQPTPQTPVQQQPTPQTHNQTVHIQQNTVRPQTPINEITISLPASPAVTPTELKSKNSSMASMASMASMESMVVMEVVVSHSPQSVPNKIQIEEYNDDDDLDAELEDEGLLDELH